MTRMPLLTSPTSLACWLMLCLHSLPARAQADTSDLGRRMVSPSGYTGVINTPSAHVQGWGVANLSWANSNPEYARTISQGSFGSLNAGFGLLPELEVVGRLAYEGDLHCNQYRPGCAAGARDLSLSAKYQLPLDLGPHTRVAVGATDFGGAATNFRQVYGVATTQWQDMEFSLGYSHASSTRALLHGTFGSVRYALSPGWQLLAEHDTQEKRAGLQYHRALGDRASIVAGYSRKWTRNTGQEANQLQLAWVFHTDRTSPRPINTSASMPSSSTAASAILASAATPTPQAQQAPTQAPIQAPTEPATAQSIAQALQALGFANVQVDHWPAHSQQSGLWHITAEPRAYRQSQVEAIGHAISPWLDALRQKRIDGKDQLHVTLTYQRQAVLHAWAQGDCLDQWAQGATCAASKTPVQLSRDPIAEAQTAVKAAKTSALSAASSAAQTAQASAGASWAPQLTLGPALRNTLGTEYGLMDYSLAAQIGAEVALAPGLFWQGAYVVPISNSDDYQYGKAFGDSRYAKSQWQSSQLTYWRPLGLGISAQASVGQLTPGQTGGQWDALWMNADGRLRLGVTGGRYTNDQTVRKQQPLFAQARYSVIPGAWHAEVTAGQFMNGDRGYKLASVHWAGDTRIALHYQKTGASDLPSLPRRSFAGFAVSFPFGPKTATALGPVWLRAQDRWSWGVQTQVGESDNKLTTGYADMPRQAQGLWSDVTDHDRNGFADLQAQLPRLRALLYKAIP